MQKSKKDLVSNFKKNNLQLHASNICEIKKICLFLDILNIDYKDLIPFNKKNAINIFLDNSDSFKLVLMIDNFNSDPKNLIISVWMNSYENMKMITKIVAEIRMLLNTEN